VWGNEKIDHVRAVVFLFGLAHGKAGRWLVI
jgi:hypothetical protein